MKQKEKNQNALDCFARFRRKGKIWEENRRKIYLLINLCVACFAGDTIRGGKPG